MRNPRPCWVCRSPKSEHDDPEAYKPAPRTEPLRANRRKTKVTLRPSSEPAQGWTTSDVLRIEFAQLAERQQWDGEHYIAVSALRDFLDAEGKQAHIDREGFTELHYRYYYSGLANGLHKVYERFCSED